MNKKLTLNVLLVVMVVLNVALLAFILFNGPNRPKAKGKNFIQKEFGLTDEQMVTLEKSKDVHIKATRALNDKIQKSSIEYYQYVGDPMVKDSLLQIVTTLNKSFYQINDKHIDELRALCSPDKQDELERFIKAQIGRANNGPPRLPRDKHKHK